MDTLTLWILLCFTDAPALGDAKPASPETINSQSHVTSRKTGYLFVNLIQIMYHTNRHM